MRLCSIQLLMNIFVTLGFSLLFFFIVLHHDFAEIGRKKHVFLYLVLMVYNCYKLRQTAIV